jgi:hypothetical protein
MTTSTAFGVLDNQAIKFLAGFRGPCITIVVPSHHPGAQEGSRRALVHSLIRTAGERIVQDRLVADAADLLAPLEEIAQESGIDTGGAGFVMFRSPEVMARYHVPTSAWERPVEKVIIGDHFYLAPFVADALSLHEFFILGLSRKHLRLFRYRNGECQEQPIPGDVLTSLEAAGAFDQPDHRLETRSATGPSTGSMGGVHIGTQSDREALPEYVHHFFGSVDRGLKATLAGKPLLLMGVHEEIAAYRRVAKYAHILTPESLGNTEFWTASDIAKRATEACRAYSQEVAGKVLFEYQDMPGRGRTLSDVLAIARAADEGRVHRLCVRSGTEVPGPGGEDLINAALVETLRTEGEVFVVPQEKMSAANPIVAILRY